MAHRGIDDLSSKRDQVLAWNVCFMTSNTRSWWHVFSPRWCRHVLAFGYAPEANAWVVINPASERTLVQVIPDNAFALWLDQLSMLNPVILRIWARNAHTGRHRFGHWCSTTVARLTGVAGGAWRPLALYRSLRRAGAVGAFGTVIDVVQGNRPEGRSGNQAAPRTGGEPRGDVAD